MAFKRWLAGTLLVVVAALFVGITSYGSAVSQGGPSEAFNASADGLPDPVAVVNGEPIAAIAYARVRDAGAEQQRLFEGTALETMSPVADPLDLLIDQVLLHQAARRLGMEVSWDDAVAYVEYLDKRLATMNEDHRSAAEALLAAQGLPTDNLASSTDVVETYRTGMEIGRVRAYARQQAGVSRDTFMLDDARAAVAQFLREERQRSEIEVFLEAEGG